MAAGRRIAVPEYAVTAIGGEAHAQTFTIECRVPALGCRRMGTGTNRRAAEQAAPRMRSRGSRPPGDARGS
jgi:ribonuclease-3